MVCKKFKAYKFISFLDIFGITYFFRVDNKDKHVSVFGGIMTVICISLCIYFAIFSLLDFIKNEDLHLQYINRYNNDEIFTNPKNFHLSLTFNYWDKKTNPSELKTVRGSEFEKYFTIELVHTIKF
jgi:amino acid transporter